MTARSPGVRAAALFLLVMWGAAHAAMFDDNEARRQITVERKRVDELNAQVSAQQQAIDARMAKLEEALKSQSLLDLFTQLEALKLEMNKLRGQLEVINNSVENTAKRQRDMYLDLDTRLRRFEQAGASAVTPPQASGAASPESPPVAGAPAALPSPTPPAPPASPPPAAVAAPAPVAPSDPAAENRSYEAAQALRRVGNYQGAIVAFQNFLKQYPRSNLAPRAQYWIGDSYFNLRDFKLAIANQQQLIKSYPESPTVPDAMLNIASSQIEMGESVVGRRTLDDLVARFPISEAADKAKRRLATLGTPAAASGR